MTGSYISNINNTENLWNSIHTWYVANPFHTGEEQLFTEHRITPSNFTFHNKSIAKLAILLSPHKIINMLALQLLFLIGKAPVY